MVLGASVGAFPLCYYGSSLNSWSDANIPAVVGLLLLELPYVLMALMLAFLHDSPVAAMPWTILASMVRLGASYGRLTLFVAAALGISLTAIGVVYLRASAPLLALRHRLARLLGRRAMDRNRRNAGSRELLLSAPQHAAMASREPEVGCRMAALIKPCERRLCDRRVRLFSL